MADTASHVWTPCRFCGRDSPKTVDTGSFFLECECGAATMAFENQQDAVADWQMGLHHPVSEISGQVPDDLITLRARIVELEAENARLKVGRVREAAVVKAAIVWANDRPLGQRAVDKLLSAIRALSGEREG